MSFVYYANNHRVAFVGSLLALLALSSVASHAHAQAAGGPAPASAGGNAPASGGGGSATQGGGAQSAPSTSTTTTNFFPGGVAPVPPGGTLGGGNTQFSSSKPLTGDQRDSFDFQRGGGAGGTAHGNENSSFVLGGGSASNGPSNAAQHLVRKGDTLWDICDHYFQNPYQWPRIWAFNPQIQNPHWIFPGDQVRLRGSTATALASDPQATAAGGLVERRRQVAPETIFLRNEGYIDDDTSNWGEVSGSPEEKMILTDNDEIYLHIGTNHEINVGQELTLYRPIRSVGGGKLIEIQGTAKVDQWNSKDGVARAKIVEALDAIERGARVGPVVRRFEVVSPLRNEKDVSATILTSIQPHQLLGQNQVVFLNKGEDAGLRPGNRLFVIRKGDAWHGTQTTTSSAKRIALEDDSPAATENVPKPRDIGSLPEEVQAELRVINVRKRTSMALVITSKHEIEAGDQAVARKGY